METRLIAEDNDACQFCRKIGEAWDNEVLVKGVQVIRFFSCIECKKKLFKLLKQWN